VGCPTDSNCSPLGPYGTRVEDPGGAPLDQLPGQPLDLAFSLRLAISLSTAIGPLHQCGVIHKDIKPANVPLTEGLSIASPARGC
jgi:serine/threonine protein kinase